jgi:rubrerythrin
MMPLERHKEVRVMRKMTDGNLRAAFAGESQAHMKYLIFAEEAEKTGRKNTARLFRAIAYAEQIHATNHFKALGEIGDEMANLDAAIGGETFEVEEMYPAYYAVARLQEEKDAIKSIKWAIEAEKIHAGLYQKARQAEETGEDVRMDAVFICSVCGYTAEGDPPERCPLCGVLKGEFKAFE